MLDIIKLQEIAEDLGIEVRFDRKPGIYDEEGKIASYEDVMSGFINKVTIKETKHINNFFDDLLDSEYNRKIKIDFIDLEESRFDPQKISGNDLSTSLAA